MISKQSLLRLRISTEKLPPLVIIAGGQQYVVVRDAWLSRPAVKTEIIPLQLLFSKLNTEMSAGGWHVVHCNSGRSTYVSWKEYKIVTSSHQGWDVSPIFSTLSLLQYS